MQLVAHVLNSSCAGVVLATTATLVLSASLATAPPAGAQPGGGTIVYISEADEQVWIATPDGSQRHQVTDGGRWFSPSMADDGTILAVQADPEFGNEDLLVRMTQGGQVLSSFTPPIVFDLGISTAEIQAGGELALYYTITGSGAGVGGQTFMVPADGTPGEIVGSSSSFDRGGSWYPGRDIAAAGEDDVLNTFAAGDEGSTAWIDRFNLVINDTAFAPAGDLLAIAGCDFGTDREGCDQIEFHELSGPPPAATTMRSCVITNAEQLSYDTVSFSPDGRSVVVGLREASIFSDLTQDVVVYSDVDPTTCAADVRTLVEDAYAPFWSPAPFDPSGGPGPSPGPPPGGSSSPPAPDEPLLSLTDGGRIDGGGSGDPVGQTIATSQSVWADGGAELVVLATADRFPDALAGAALAGERGPILVTPTAPDLDPRIHAEISRVTGGNGLVLILGGTAAITDTTAQQARQAAGSPTCPTPYPGDCRYAGTGREHTAALIAQTVLDRDGSLGRVLLARGDAFADAITGGAYAAEAGIPILLTPSTELNTFTRTLITDNAITEVIILGGTAAITQHVADQLPVISRRIAGADRTATAAAIATDLWAAEDLAGGGIVLVNVRHEQGWPAALAAASISALANAPQLGVENPPAQPTQTTIDTARTLGGPIETHASPDLVTDTQLAALR